MEIMSGEEDIELRELVAQTLESNGSLAKIRAQLRASIFLALEEDTKLSKKQPLLNNKLKSYQKSAQGKAAFCIVREFLDFFNLDFTLSVYEPESYSGTGYKYEGKQKLITDLGVDGLELNSACPILLQLLSIAQRRKSESLGDFKGNSNNANVTITNGSAKVMHDEIPKEQQESKTELDDSSSIVNSKNDINTLKSKSNVEVHPTDELKQNKLDLEIDIPRVNLNDTYDVTSSSTVTSEESESDNVSNDNEIRNPHLETLLNPQSLKSSSYKEASEKEDSEKDDTYEGTSLISDDNLSPQRMHTLPENLGGKVITGSINLNYSDENCTSNNKENKTKYNIDKPKLSPQKSEKLKPKTSLSSLSDLPPLPVGKPRMSDILPSPYSKEFKDKTNLRDLDEMFDMQVEYEEDFISGSELDLSMNKSQVNSVVDLSKPESSGNSEQNEMINGDHTPSVVKSNKEQWNHDAKISSSHDNSSTISEHIITNSESQNAPK